MAERAVWAMAQSDSDFADLPQIERLVRTSRLEFLRARVSAAAGELAWQQSPVFDAADRGLARAFESWKSNALPLDATSADQLMLQPLTIAEYMAPQGAAFYLLHWLLSDAPECEDCIQPNWLIGELSLTVPQVMAGAAVAWIDGAMKARKVTDRVRLLAQAGQALELMARFDAANQPAATDYGRESAADYGRKGAERRHAGTRRLKDWALAESRNLRDSERGISRQLVKRLPEDLKSNSVDPERLIYDALREARKTN